MYIRLAPFTPVTSTSRNIARSAIWNHVGKVAEYALFYFSMIVVARGLGVEKNGHLAGLLSVVQLLIVLSSAGIEVSLNKYLPQAGGTNAGTRYLVVRLLLVRLGLYAAVCGLAMFVFPVVMPSRSKDWADFLSLMIVLGLLRSAAPVLGMLLIARFRTPQAATVGVLARSAELSALFFVGSAITIPVVLVILVAGSAMQVAGYAITARAEWVGESRRISVVPVVTFGAVFWLNTIIDYFLGRQGDVMFLTFLRPESSSASLYDVAYSIVQVGTLALTAGFAGVSLAAMSQFAVNDRARMNALYGVVVRITSLLTIPVLAFLIVVAPELLRLLYSDKYAGAVDVLRIILGLRIASRLFATGENADYLLALGRVWRVVGIGMIAACATITMHFILIPRWGATGAAWAGGVGVLLANVLGGLSVHRLGGVPLQWRTWIRIMAATLVAVVASLLIPHFAIPFLHIVLSAVAFFIVFALLTAAFRPLHREDMDTIRAVLRSLAGPLRIVSGSA